MHTNEFSSINECINELTLQSDVLDIINCSDYNIQSFDFYNRIKKNYKETFNANQRIIFVITEDYYNDIGIGLILQKIQIIVNFVDISNYFISIVTTNKDIHSEYKQILETTSIDPVSFNLYQCAGEFIKHPTDLRNFTKYKLFNIEKSNFNNLTDKQKKLLYESKHFCLAPWIHLMIKSNKDVLPCCRSSNVIGKSNDASLKEFWNSEKIKEMRITLLKDDPFPGCERCYNDEKYGKESNRNAFNDKFSSQIHKINT